MGESRLIRQFRQRANPRARIIRILRLLTIGRPFIVSSQPASPRRAFPRRHYVYVYRGMMHDRFRLGLLRSETMPARYPVTILLAMGIAVAPAFGQAFVAPSNRVALSFGMTPQEASQTLGVPLYCVRCSRGSELLLAIPNVKGAALSFRSDGLYLQFRKGRLTGWKGDWGTIRP